MRIDWIGKLRHLLQTFAFCLAIATLQVAFTPERPYAPVVAYSMAIGFFSWAIIDLGRDFVPSARETGWPTGLGGVMLVMAGIMGGFVLGTLTGDVLCRTFGLYPQGAGHMDKLPGLRGSILITAIAGIAVSYYFYSTNKSAYLERKMGEARQHADEARLKLLETQLEPHMLFNTLANLRALIPVDPARAQEMLDHMIAYLRATLDGSRSTTHSLQAEFDRLHDYLALMAIRMGTRLGYALVLPDDLAGERVPTLLLQPLVENSIRHGLEPQVAGGTIRVSARREGGLLVLEVADTGVGGEHVPADAKGFGLAQIRERLATLYGPAASLRFTIAPGAGATARIELPLGAA